MRIKWFSLVRIAGLFLVLFYHFFQSIFPGGFIGVDIFFTFSGFLITSLLIDEFIKSKTVDIKGFLWRRFYRIVPALVFMILIVMPFTLLVRRDYIAGIGGQIAASIGFVTNFYEMLTGGNYESQFIPHIFVHTWSLALEMHYYIIWGLTVWYITKKSKTVGQLRGYIFLVSTGLTLLSFLSMFIGAFLTKNYSNLYFFSWTHIFPFFIGSSLATISGVTNVGTMVKRLDKKWSRNRTIQIFAGSFALLVILGFVLRFNSVFTYLFGFLAASLLTALMIIAARVLHDQTATIAEPKFVTFLADTSYGVYLFHWPFYIIFSQLLHNLLAVIVTIFLSLVFAAASFYVLEPTLQGRQPQFFGVPIDIRGMKKPMLGVLSALVVVTVVITVMAPKVGEFEQNLVVNGLKQADQKLQLTRQQVDQAKASKYNVATGTTLIGDSVSLRASEFLQAAIPGIQIDATISRNLETGMDIYKADISNKVLLQNVVIALGTNSVETYKEQLDKIVNDLPKGHRLIFVTPYDGRVAGDANNDAVKTRAYELELAKKYDFITIADWYQVAQENPAIWTGTDYVHFGADNATITAGGELYAKTLKTALDEANKGSVKP